MDVVDEYDVPRSDLTNFHLDKMGAISRMTFLDAFWWMKVLYFD